MVVEEKDAPVVACCLDQAWSALVQFKSFRVMSCRIVSFRVSACQVSWGLNFSIQVGVVEFGRDPVQLGFIDAIRFETIRIESYKV